MPLVRVHVRNEYGLGRPELYKGTNREDPKAVLDGVVVAGLVGILRQLGDLADFAAEVFHGLQEQVLTTASRSHKLMLRAQNIEASLPPLEKAILAQTSHIHFAYTAGCEWRSCAKTEQNQFFYNDLPQFIMDSYEECRDPPRLHLLDKFDPGGPGSCLRRYSDPTFLKRVSADSDEAHIEKTERSRKTSRSKKKRLSRRNGETLQGEQMHSHGSRRTSSSQTADAVLESDLEDHSYSVDSRADVGQRKSLSRRNGETLQVEQMQCNDGRRTSSSQTADVVLELDLEDHSYSVDSRANVGQKKSWSQRNGKMLLGEQMHSNDGRRTSSSQTADVVLELDLENHSYSVDSRANVGQKKSLSRRNGETLLGEQMHSNDGRRTSSSQTADVVLESDMEDHSYSVDSRADVGQRKSLSQRNGETVQGEQMHSNDGRMQFASHVNGQTSSSQAADVLLELDLEDHSYSVDSRANVGQRKSWSRRNGETLVGEQMHSHDGRRTSSLQTADAVLEPDLEDHSYSVDSRADVGQRKNLSRINGETVQGEQMHSNDGRMQLASHVNGQTSSSQTADVVLGLDLEDHSYSVDSRANVGQRKSWSQRNGETLVGEQMHSNDGRRTSSSQTADAVLECIIHRRTSSSQTADAVLESDLEDYSYSADSIADVGQRKSLSHRNGEIVQGEQMHSNDGRMQFASHVNGQTSSSQTADVVPESDLEDHSYSDLRVDAGYIECVFQPSNSVQFDEPECKESPSSRLTEKTDALQSAFPTIDYNFSHVLSDEQIASTSTVLTWDDKEEIVDSESQWCDKDEIPEVLDETHNLHMHGDEPVAPENSDFLYGEEINLKTVSSMIQTDETDSEPDNYLDALNTIESESENDLDCEAKREAEQFTSHVSSDVMGNGVGATSTVLDHDFYNVFSHTISTVSLNMETGLDFPETLQEIPPLISERHVTSLSNPVQSDVPDNKERTNILVASYDSGSPIHEPVPDICGNSVLDCSLGPNPLDVACSLNDTLSTSIETVPSKALVNIESKRNLVDSHGSESPTHELEPHQPANHVLDCTIGTNPVDDAHILDNAVSLSIESVQSNVIVNREMTESLGDASEYHIGEQMPHICGNSVFDIAHNDSLSESSENVRSDGFVNSETAKNLADSRAHQNPIHEQVSHVCGSSVLECSVGTNPLSDHPTLNDSVSTSIEIDPSDDPVNFERTKNLADSHGSVNTIHEQSPQISGNSVLNCLGGTNPLGDDHTLHDTVSASIEIDPSDDPVNFERTKNLSDSHGSVNTIHEQLPHIGGNSVLNCLGGTDPLQDDHTLHDTVSASIDTDILSGSKSSDLPKKEADGIDSNVCKSKETPSEPASDPSVGLWTNGGLLGLQPSKPPDFIMSSFLNQGPMTSTNDTDGIPNHNSMLKSNGHKEEQDLSKISELNQKEPSSRCLVSQCVDQASFSGKTSKSHWQSSRHGQNDEDFDKNRVPIPGTVVPVAHTGCTEPIKESGLNSPLLFGLGHKLLINSFCRKVSFDEKSGHDNSVKTGLLEQSGQNSTVQQSLPETTSKEHVGYDYPIYSPPPSPPLEHMKISFCPVDRFETFKLKMKFPDVSNHSDSTRDVFPSFWLVPEHSILVHDSGSNSDDDDTFCRSSPFVSDDCLSPHSDDNSDQWESDDTPDISGDGVYDSSHRISLIESKSSSQEVRGVTNVDINLDSEHIMLTQDSAEPSLSGHLLDFPSFDTMNPVLGKECNNHCDYDNNLKLQGHAESIPPARLLPLNQRSEMMNEKQNCMSKDTGQINDPSISESTLQGRPTLGEQNPTDHDDIPPKLRDKSFNQKHTVTRKPNDIISPTTTDKVAAILEKANAIRQVISSDDGEDDGSWSDT